VRCDQKQPRVLQLGCKSTTRHARSCPGSILHAGACNALQYRHMLDMLSCPCPPLILGPERTMGRCEVYHQKGSGRSLQRQITLTMTCQLRTVRPRGSVISRAQSAPAWLLELRPPCPLVPRPQIASLSMLCPAVQECIFMIAFQARPHN